MAERSDLKEIAITKIRGLLVALGELREKESAILAEIDALAGGNAGIGALLKAAELAYSDAWRVRYGTYYVWSYAKDRPNLKRLILQLGLPELTARMVRYIGSADDFLAKNRHPFGLFVSGVNAYAAAAVSPEQTAGEFDLDADAAATRRRTEDLRR